MKMNNNIKLNEDYVVDLELLLFEKLIEEREAYEERFFSLEPLTDEFEHIISRYDQELKEQEINYSLLDFQDCPLDSFEFEDRQNQLRDEKLIEEREIYEENHLSIILDDFALNDFYDYQIEAREEEEFLERNGYDYDFKYEPEFDYEYGQYEEEMFWNLHYLRESQFAAPECGCAYLDYMPNDDGLCDYLDCYDYPEGPDENLNGIKYC